MNGWVNHKFEEKKFRDYWKHFVMKLELFYEYIMFGGYLKGELWIASFIVCQPSSRDGKLMRLFGITM